MTLGQGFDMKWTYYSFQTKHSEKIKFVYPSIVTPLGVKKNHLIFHYVSNPSSMYVSNVLNWGSVYDSEFKTAFNYTYLLVFVSLFSWI